MQMWKREKNTTTKSHQVSQAHLGMCQVHFGVFCCEEAALQMLTQCQSQCPGNRKGPRNRGVVWAKGRSVCWI